MALQITDSNFDDLLAQGKPMVVDFWATWCGPCKKIGPYIEELAQQYADQVIMIGAAPKAAFEAKIQSLLK